MLADPLKNVVLPFGLAEAEADPERVAKYYPPGSPIPPLYTAPDNQALPGGPAGYNPKLYWLERTTYALIWIIPIALLLPRLLLLLGRRG